MRGSCVESRGCLAAVLGLALALGSISARADEPVAAPPVEPVAVAAAPAAMGGESYVSRDLFRLTPVLVPTSVGSESAQDAAAAPAASSEEPELGEWSFSLTPYLWLFSAHTVLRADSVRGSGSYSFSDFTDSGDVGLAVQFEADKTGEFGLFGEISYFGFEDRFSGVKADMDLWYIELGFAYPVHTTQIGNSEREASFDLLAGNRYFSGRNKLRPLGAPKFRDSDEWLDIFIGGRGRFEVTDFVDVYTRLDLGGFRLGGSTLTWNLLAGVELAIAENTSLNVGYRIFDIDYTSDSGSSGFEIDGNFRGFYTGFTIGL